MSKVLRSDFGEWEILYLHENPGEGIVMTFNDLYDAQQFLHFSLKDLFCIMTLRQVLAEVSPQTSVYRLNDHEVLNQIANQLVCGRLKIINRSPSKLQATSTSPSSQKAKPMQSAIPISPSYIEENKNNVTTETMQSDQPVEPEVEIPQTIVEPPLSSEWIQIVIVDDNGSPISGKRYRLDLPDGQSVTDQLDSTGTIRVDNISPGICTFSFLLDDSG